MDLELSEIAMKILNKNCIKFIFYQRAYDKLDMVTRAYNHSPWEAEGVGLLQVGGQPGLPCETHLRPCLMR